MREGLDFAGVEYRERVVTCRRDHAPWYGTRPAYWLCSALLLSWPLRLWIGSRTAHVRFVVHKRFGVRVTHATPTHATQPPRAPLTLCYDAYAPEASTRSEFEMAPSYSLAMLMRSTRKVNAGSTGWTKGANEIRRSRSAVGEFSGGYDAILPRSKTFQEPSLPVGGDGSSGDSATREELMRLLDPIPKPERVPPPEHFPMCRLQRLPKVQWPPTNEDVDGEAGVTVGVPVGVSVGVSADPGEQDARDFNTSRPRHMDYGVTYSRGGGRLMFFDDGGGGDGCATGNRACLDTEGRGSRGDGPPSYDEAVSLRSIGRRLSQIFERLRGSEQSLLAEEI